ncbi:MAG: SNF2-related protein [Bacteroidales bacterium]|nr:SNF2-related protein [Bacteroidales bacterium]
MNLKQIDYYNSLSDSEQFVLNIGAMIADNISVYYFPANSLRRKKISNKLVEIFLEDACKNGLFVKSLKEGGYSVSPEFLIYIFPQLKSYTFEWEYVNDRYRYFYYGTSYIRNLRDFLHCLLFNQLKYQEAELKFLNNGFAQLSYFMTGILDYVPYNESLSLMKISIVSQLLENKIQKCISELEPIAQMHKYIEDFKTKVSPENAIKLPAVSVNQNFHLGNLNEALAANTFEVTNHTIPALSHLLKGDIKLALAYFERSLKSQRLFVRGSQLPIVPHDAFYYLIALLSIAPEESAPVFQKIHLAVQKKSYSSSDVIYLPVLYYAVNDKKSLSKSLELLYENILADSQDYRGLISFMVLYLVESVPDRKFLTTAFQITQKAWTNGYRLLAYEAAYILKQWNNDAENDTLFQKIAGNFGFPPALSHISRQEDWEKSLNVFLSMGAGNGNAKGKDEQGKYRVVYYINFKRLFIQPVLQSRTAKGAWSTGRNIALKTFYAGKVEGMMEQDYRVSKQVKHSNGYYDDEYSLPFDAIKVLAGHPYVYLFGTTDLPVELIASQPVLQVVKTLKGYTLATDITDSSEQFIIEKETNTRYKIYDLSTQQQKVIEAIRQQKITVPESGKEKLMQVLGNFSSQFTVHSDLSVSEHTKVKKVAADPRIRVQLLPMGDGLKAELFAKPFGLHPPYCKPGKGGKTLIASEKGEQLQVTRDLAREAEFANQLMEKIQALETLDINNDLIAFGDPLDSLHLLDILGEHQDKCVVEWPEGERFKIRGTVNFGNLNLKIKTQTNWFELQGELKVDEDTVITIQQLLQLTEKGHNRFIELKQGEFLALSERLKKQLDELRTFSSSGKEGLHINKFASVALGDFLGDVANLKSDKSWKDFQRRLDLVQNTETQIPSNLQADLRPYQEEGFRWLSHLAEWEAGACLADDMGLGKTIQALAILLHRAPSGPALVISPVSVIPNWISETAKFAPSLKVKMLTPVNRAQTLKSLEPGDLLITSYGLLQSEEQAFAQTIFATIVLDEAHSIKNYNTKTSKAAMLLQAPFRMILTGTPVQNHLGEVWNLFNFINPGLLGSLSHFTDTYIKPENDVARKHLKKLISPFILRRTKSAVLDELPAKTEIIRKVELSTEEMAFYEALRRKAIASLENDDSAQGTKHLKALAEITRLRQACCNPALVNPELNISSTKLATFLEIVAELIENKHKALVFSQFVTHLALVRKALDDLGITYQYLDGSCSMTDREKSVKKFQGGEGDLFLISLKAGGLGLNLTAADFVIHLDPWWNPAVEDQASDRAHRIGQIRPVTIYRLVAQNTIEEKIIHLHNTKRDLADTLLEGSDQSAKLSMAELVSLIKDRD